jgi:hypothetical protein
MPTPLPSIILPKGYLLLSQIKGNLDMDNNSYLAGSAVMVNDLCEMYSVGEVVLFNPNDGIIVRHTSEGSVYVYYIVREDSILYKQN